MDENRLKDNQPMIDCIIACLKGLKIKKGHQPYEYLLGQAIREYAIPIENWHLSRAAQKEWDKLTSDDITHFFFNETIRCDKAKQTPVRYYIGASKKWYDTIVPEQTKCLRFNNVFICEHTTPVKMIQNRLLNLDSITEAAVVDVLETIHITRMLKEEDHKIKEKWQREGSFTEIVERVYNKIGIELAY